ncbi:SDR family oxidoreductase [Methylobacterium oryzisoli]|uniref:SDR family oxidoreductase n=1 Tax=Methylobacterium oryzisoli TaxID=3385502 RepID=UPI00389123E9
MKIVVIGGTGLIGGKLAERLWGGGHEVVAASPSTGVNAVTGEGLAAALAGAEIVVDVANAPSFADEAVMDFFTRSSRNLLAAGAEAGVRHHVALSVVGTDRLTASGYFRAKLAQEDLITAGPVPFTIVRATQFFEFLDGIAQAATRDGRVHLPSAQVQPMLSDDVAAALAEVALAAPAGGRVEIAGPEPFRMDEVIRRLLSVRGDPRPVVTDPDAAYFGVLLDERSLLPGPQARLAPTRFDAWLDRAARPV